MRPERSRCSRHHRIASSRAARAFRRLRCCVLQHLEESQQIVAKQQVLTDNLTRIGHVSPGTVLPALVGDSWGYRRKGRFSVRRVEKKDKTLVGFRELGSAGFVADLSQCLTVIPEIGSKVGVLSAFIETLDGKRDIPQIEFIAGDAAIALTVRYSAAAQ